MKTIKTIVVDAGSTKAEWALIYSDNTIGESIILPGINPAIADSDAIPAHFYNAASKIEGSSEAYSIYYYGAGCATPGICSKVKGALLTAWPKASVNVASDLEGAAKALLGHEKGIACILGTGSNSCLYNGEKIIMNTPPLGFILGDEGSGTALGKRLLNAVFKDTIPWDLKNQFFLEYDLSLAEVIERVYRSPEPNKFIASFVPFIRNYIDDSFIHNMVVDEFLNFFRHNVNPYPDAQLYRPAFTGSVAFHFKDCLEEAAQREGYQIGKVEKAPMAALLDFHVKLSEL